VLWDKNNLRAGDAKTVGKLGNLGETGEIVKQKYTKESPCKPE